MATRGIIVGSIALVVLFTLAAGCTFWTGPSGPPATGTPQAATPASTGAGGAEETPSTVATTVPPTPTTIATTAVPTKSPTATPTATAVPADAAATAETTVSTTLTTLTPLPLPTGISTIAELAAADPDLSRFAQALRQGGIYETLDGTGTYTVFAPDNAAFDAVPPGTLSRLLFDREAPLAAVADYHVIYGRWLAADLMHESSVATRSGAPLAVTQLPDGTLQVDGARVTRADIVASNGVLHVIDRVMIPPGVS